MLDPIQIPVTDLKRGSSVHLITFHMVTNFNFKQVSGAGGNEVWHDRQKYVKVRGKNCCSSAEMASF